MSATSRFLEGKLRAGGLTLSLSLLICIPTEPTGAQTRDRGPLVLDLPSSTRALALGNSFTMGSRDSDAIFYHPGLLNRAQGMAASLQRFSTNGTLTAFSAGTTWFGGGVVIGIQHLGYETSTLGTGTVDEILALSPDEATLRESGNVGVSELAVSAGYGRTFKGLRIGAVGKMVEQRFGPRKASTLAADLGLARSAGPVTVGLAIQNLGTDLVIGGGDIPLPTRLTVGASSRSTQIGPLDVSASTAVSYKLEGDWVPSLGMEVAYWPVNGRTFAARVGYRRLSEDFTAVPFTFGGAFMGDNIILEYTYQGYDSGDPSHRFTIGWR